VLLDVEVVAIVVAFLVLAVVLLTLLDVAVEAVRLRACADRLATFHICRFSERLNRLLIAH
jgi:hypothetical protein